MTTQEVIDEVKFPQKNYMIVEAKDSDLKHLETIVTHSDSDSELKDWDDIFDVLQVKDKSGVDLDVDFSVRGLTTLQSRNTSARDILARLVIATSSDMYDLKFNPDFDHHRKRLWLTEAHIAIDYVWRKTN